jgi:hypothetical protein
VRLGVNLPGPFWASFNLSGRRSRGRRTSGNAGCLTGLLTLFFLPFYLIAKLYQFAWGKPQTQRGKVLSVSGVSVGLLILVIIGAAAGGGSSSPTPSPVASVAPVVAQFSPTSSPTHKAAASKSPTPVATSAAASSSSPAPVPTHSQQAPAPATSAPAPVAPACYPLTSGGNCYEPGEFCPAKDHGMSGIAGDGKSITCSYYPSSGTWHWKD